MRALSQGLPAPTTPLVDPSGRLTSVWLSFLMTLWARTGGASPTASFAGGLTATGSSQAGALLLTAALNVVTFVASGTGVRLPTAAAGLEIRVVNRGGNDLAVYPATNAQIEMFGTNAPAAIARGGDSRFIGESETQWLAT